MTIDVEAVRAATPGCASGLAFLNNAGSSLPTQRTVDTVTDHLALEARVGGYEAANLRADAIEQVRHSVARLVGGARDEVAITQSDSASFAKLLWGLVLGGNLGPGAVALVDRITYNSHYLALQQVRDRFGIRIGSLPADPDGTTDLEAAVRRITSEPPALVSCTVIGTHNGLVNDVAPLCAAARSVGAVSIVDACQALGHLPVDVAALGCDALTGTGRKFLRGPRGTGVLWVRRDLHERCNPPGIDGHSAMWVDADSYRLEPGAARFEEFEVSYATHLGLGVAVDQALEIGIEAIASRAVGLAESLRAQLAGIGGVTVRDGDGARCAITTFTVEGHSPASIAAAARAADVSINVSSAPFARLDMGPKGLEEVVRASPHYFNTDDEIARLVAVIAALG